MGLLSYDDKVKEDEKNWTCSTHNDMRNACRILRNWLQVCGLD
jgi:hypothetical protein